ncbi:hypothetical protein [Lutispora sp.]|uniref:hypothetical protein n=1 Tax=Lutispora sp. TaxID=2828727 RepID=UPI002B1F4E71|nr:hypothetical protein [Lutispora sp.]MEA4963552.1 hypothetical protein [Lutispora sp.]
MNKKKLIVIGALIIFAFSIIRMVANIGGSQNASAIDKYYDKDLKGLGVEDSLSGAIDKLTEASKEYESAAAEGKPVDWTILEPKFNDAIKEMEAKKAEIEALNIEDEKVKEINSYLISSYDGMIKGYKQLVQGMKEGNNEMIRSADETLRKAQDDIGKWQTMMNE